MTPHPLTSFTLYRWTNAETTCDYPFLAVAEDGTTFLSLGNHHLCFEWSVPDEAVAWLERDFGPAGTLRCDLATLRHVLDTIFVGGVEFGLIGFDAALKPNRVELSLSVQHLADENPEYYLDGPSAKLRTRYQRFYRETGKSYPVSAAERAMLDVCVSTFAELSAQCAAQLQAPPPPRYHLGGHLPVPPR